MRRNKPWKKLSSRYVYKNPWIRVREDKVIRPDSTRGIYGVVELPGSSAVVAVDNKKQLYLIKQYRYPLQAYTVELPWGSRQHRESYLQAGKRELREEAGITAGIWKALGKVADIPGIGDEYAYLYLARDLTFGKPIVPSEEGEQKVFSIPFTKAYQQALEGTIKDAVTVAGIVRAKQYIK